MRATSNLPRAFTALWLASVAGCSSQPVNLAPLPPAHYRVLGKASGRACGVFGFFGPAINVVPIAMNERVDEAHRRAIQSVPGATGLINVGLQDEWYWWLIGTTRCTTVTGDAIQEVRP